MNMITTKDVSKNFGSLQAVKDVSFVIEKGEIVGFLGQNGAGKTTLMRILTGFLPASKGFVTVAGLDIEQETLEIQKKIGYRPEIPPLYPQMTVKEYLAFAARLKEVSSKLRQRQIDKVLSDCNLIGVKNRNIGTLSMGYRQRVGIAQAIISEPDILILDEPTKGLDPLQIIQVRSLIKDLKETRTVILSTHILSEIEQIAQRVLMINQGEIIVDDSMEKLLKAHSQNFFVLRVRGDCSIIEDTLKESEHVQLLKQSSKGEGIFELDLEMMEGQDYRNALMTRLIANDIQILEFQHKRTSLEEIFLKMNLPLEVK